MDSLYEDIFQHQFKTLFNVIKTIIGRNTIFTTDENCDLGGKEAANNSNLIFDIIGTDYKFLKAANNEYMYWVEVYIIKIIENMLERKGISFVECCYHDDNEPYSILYHTGEKTIEAYFLFDIMFNESGYTDYDKLAFVLKERSKGKEIDEINVYIFRDRISTDTIAWLFENELEGANKKFISITTLRNFFISLFAEKDYLTFEAYAKEFIIKCNCIISYKTVITPTANTMTAFRNKKQIMLRTVNYKAIADKGDSADLSSDEFIIVNKNYIDECRYTALSSSNDFAESFISAEWLYDVYSNSMGELELTGIIAGYLKSIEQLLYMIAQFRINKGIKIRTKNNQFIPYSSNVEDIIDSTLKSLNDFITSPKNNITVDKKIRGCIKKTVDVWRKYERNGYFHKHNLHQSDNKIDDVRQMTLFLYFLILNSHSYYHL